jgi:hypothetical protein
LRAWWNISKPRSALRAFPKNYNIPPQSNVPVLYHDGNKVVFTFFWWLVPQLLKGKNTNNEKPYTFTLDANDQKRVKFTEGVFTLFNIRKDTCSLPWLWPPCLQKSAFTAPPFDPLPQKVITFSGAPKIQSLKK